MGQQNPFDIKGRSISSASVSIDTLRQIKVDTFEIFTNDDTAFAGNVARDSVVDTSLDYTGDTALVEESQTTDSVGESSVEPASEPSGQLEQSSDSADLLIGIKDLTEIIPALEIEQNQNTLFVITILVLLLLAILLAVNRSMINKAYRAIANDNFLRFLFREYKSMPWLYWLFYIYFFINAGFFLYLMAHYFDWFEGRFSLLLLSILAIMVVYVIKHFSLQIISSSFPVEKETQLYGFVTMLINILLGILLTPINLISAFAPEPFVEWAIWAGIFAFICLYLFRQLKGLFIAGRFLHSYRFHFFIYLCTAEIAPLLIIGKLAIGNLGF